MWSFSLASGVLVLWVTPLAQRDSLGHAGLHRLIDHILADGVQARISLGTTGERPSLSYRLRRELVQ